MSLYVRVDTNFYSHRKTLRLKAALGDDAFWIPPRLWSYAATNQPDGDFRSYTANEIAACIGYSKNASSMLQALLQAGFLDEDMKIHDWFEHNGYHKVFAERAKKAAEARWEKERNKERTKTGEERRGEEGSIAASTASSMLQASNPPRNGFAHTKLPKPSKKFIREIQIQIEEAEQERTRLKNSHALVTATGTQWDSEPDRQAFIDLGRKVKAWRKEMFDQ